jgi:DNA-binding CsgD family transcriptional regulator
MAEGMRNKEIAAALGISADTTGMHLKNLFTKLDVHDRTAAVAKAIRRGIIRIQ